MNVLIATDSMLFRARLATVMTEMGGIEPAIMAGDVSAALGALRHAYVDLVVLDAEMPGGDSFQVLAEAKTGGNDIPVIVLTAFPQYRQRFLAAGADYFFDKAAEFEQVVAVLRETRDQQIEQILKNRVHEGENAPASLSASQAETHATG